MRNILIAALAFFMVFAATGCYDNAETDTLATVMAVGVDKGSENGVKSYTFALADTGGISDTGKGDGTSLICFTEEGEDVHSAITSLNKRLSKQLSFSHLSALLFSRLTASEDMYSDVNYFEEKASVRPQTMIGITDISAGEYLNNLSPVLEANPEKYFMSMFKKKDTYVPEMSISDFTNAYHTQTPAFAPVITTLESEGLYSENAFIAESVFVYDGKAIERIEDNWILGLFLSTKTVSYNDYDIRSEKKPDINVNIRGKNPTADIVLFIKSDSKIDREALEGDLTAKLTGYAKRAYDIIDVATNAKKDFLLTKSYEKYDFGEIIKNIKFNITVKLSSED